ncbi:MAG: hypothetical protein SGI97_07885 [candidate division Zixibacteria bacterium]|nr:hypothetical protein [candidate division Zixibacteria bacterium]
MNRRIAIALIALFGVAMFTPEARADRRKYVWTYQFLTMPADATELEFYQTTKIGETKSWEYRVELEQGITDRWDFSVYQIFVQGEGQSLKWDAFQLRTRYKLAAPGRFFFDPLLYLEYNRKIDLTKQNKLEAKLILARDFQKINLSINPVYEFFFAPGEPVHEVGLDVGLSYELSYRFSLGIESTSRREFVKLADGETSSYFGPTLSLATGSAYYTVGYAGGLTDESDDARVRFLMGFHL